MKKLNVPNTLSLIRVILVPLFMAAVVYIDPAWGDGFWQTFGLAAIPAAIFGLTAYTDHLDGKIARKYNLITDFGKFIDPLADKFMVFGALIAILVARPDIAPIFVWVAAVIMLRELAVTSLRLVVASSAGKVVAASWWGKVKTATQCVSILLILLEPVILYAAPASFPPLCSYIAMAAMLITTIGSGIDYLRVYMPYVDTNK